MKIFNVIFAWAMPLAGCAFLGFLAAAAASGASEWKCRPTPGDAPGPFYQAGAPVRAAVGQGYVLQGVVQAARDCAPIPGAKIEFWLAGPSGDYDDAHRATVMADKSGAYRFESNFPPPYSSRPPHIHVKVTAPGFRTLVTQHYPQPDHTRATLDLVLLPAG